MGAPLSGGSLPQQSAGAYGSALNATQAGMGFNPGPAQAGFYGAAASPATAYGSQAFMASPFAAQAGQAQGGGYTPYMGGGAPGAVQGYQATGYTGAQQGPADRVVAGQLGNTDLAPYMNPYTSQVVNQTQADMERARQIEMMRSGDARTAAGAFGGSRHGVADAETNRAFYDRLGATTGQLRAAGFENAQGAALSDIGNRLNASLANQGANLQVAGANQNATNRAREFSAGAENAAGEFGGRVGMFNAGLANEADARRMAAANRAREFGAASQVDASRLNAQLGTNVSLANAADRSGASRFNAAAMGTASEANAGRATDTSRFNAGLFGDLSRFNAGQASDTSRFNAGQANDYNAQMRDALFRGGAQMGSLSNLGFGMANEITDRQNAVGSQEQAMQQQLLNDALQQFRQYTGQGDLSLAQLIAAIGAVPAPVQQESTSTPGLADIASSMASIAGGIPGV